MRRKRTDSSTKLKTSLPPFLMRANALSCIVGILLVNGFHTVALQCYGWTQMFSAYHQVVPAAEALELTFSGNDLCGICTLSQATQKTLSESLTLTLNEQKPLAPPSLSSPLSSPAERGECEAGNSRHSPLHEIVIGLDPPPPRAGRSIA